MNSFTEEMSEFIAKMIKTFIVEKFPSYNNNNNNFSQNITNIMDGLNQKIQSYFIENPKITEQEVFEEKRK